MATVQRGHHNVDNRLGHRALMLAVVLVAAAPARSEAPGTLSARLQALLERLPHAGTQVSACVLSLPSGDLVFQRQADRPLIPASNQKIISGAVALEILGPNYFFETRLLRRGDDLVIVGGGDPALGDAKLAAEGNGSALTVFEDWAQRLWSAGVRAVGDIVVEDRAWSTHWVHPSWEKEDLTSWYAAPVGSLNFNDNCIEVTVWPRSNRKLVGFEVFPPTDWIEIRNRCRSGSKNEPWLHGHTSKPQFQLRGQCNRRTPLKPVAVPDPGIFSGEVLKRVLRDRGITVRGRVFRASGAAVGDVPQQPLVVHQTPIRSVLVRSMRDSQNLFAECLMKAVGHPPATRRAPGSDAWTAAAAIMERTLRSWGIDTRGLVIADGSGLSRDNRTTARQLAAVLRHLYLDAEKGHLYIDSLSLNATHGTLKKRLRDIPQRVWAKTGYMKGIRTLSGYVRASSRQWYAFSVLFNGIPGGTLPYNRIHDDVCRALVGDDEAP